MVGLDGPELDRAAARRLCELAPGGVILFRRNLETPDQAIRLLAAVRRLVPAPTLLALDQEGGRVSRLEPFVGATPTAVELTRAGEPTVRRFGAATGAALSAMGFNLDFAPVVDLCPADARNGIGDRSFGTDPGTVTRMAGAFLEGLQDAGVAGCLKHFPGLGDTVVDSHVELPTIPRGLERLLEQDLEPYLRLGEAAASVMVGHGHYPALDDRQGMPASCSAPIVDSLLRERLGYRGLVVSDDLEMGAVAARDEEGGGAVEAIGAGCDLALYCSDLDRAERAVAALAGAADRDERFGARLIEAEARVRATAERWSAPRGDLEASRSALELFAAFA
jgi:beta-N-acetylhexosaminidase